MARSKCKHKWELIDSDIDWCIICGTLRTKVPDTKPGADMWATVYKYKCPADRERF